ncbi:MAG: cytochrome C biosynthesis protein [Cytophagales bacterium]|nr:cytochrome C biosynthesis protein [Cytophagales bacterium]
MSTQDPTPGDISSADPLVQDEGSGRTNSNSKKHAFLLLGILLCGGLGAWAWYISFQEDQNLEAQEEMFQAQYYFEADSLDKALVGDGDALGFEDIIASYEGSPAANLANFYAGVIQVKKGEWEKAIAYLEKFEVSDWLLEARKYALLGDAYMEKNDPKSAASYYWKAAQKNANEFFTPLYLQKASLAYELHKDYESALKCLSLIISDYPTSEIYQEVEKQAIRLKTLSKLPIPGST